MTLNLPLTSLMMVVRRFPGPVLAALAFTVLQLFVPPYAGYPSHWPRAIALALAPTFFATLFIALLAEARAWGRLRAAVYTFAVFVMIGAWGLHTGRSVELAHFLLSFGFLSACIAVPYWSGADNNQLWSFNQRSFWGLFIAGLACLIVYLGLLLIVITAGELFGFRRMLDPTLAYATFFAFSLFWPLYTLSFVPRLPMTGEEAAVPKPLRFVLTFVVLPLLLVYGAVIAAYAVSVLILGAPPKASVAWCIIGFATVGITLHFLLYPLREVGGVLVRLYSRFFYLLLLPYIVMLFWAIGIRIDEYGFTPERYLVVLGGLWAAGLALFAIFYRGRFKLYLPPLVLGGLLVFASFGPWGADEVSFRSQAGRLEQQLTLMGLMRDGQAIALPEGSEAPSFDNRRKLSEMLDYFSGHRAEWPAFTQTLFVSEKELFRPSSEQVMKGLNLVYVQRYDRYAGRGEEGRALSYEYSRRYSSEDALDIEGFDKLFMLSIHKSKEQQLKEAGLTVRLKDDTLVVEQGTQTVALMLPTLFEGNPKELGGRVTGEKPLQAELVLNGITVRVLLSSLQLDMVDGRWVANTANGHILVKGLPKP